MTDKVQTHQTLFEHQRIYKNEELAEEEKMFITINDVAEGPLIGGRVFDRKSQIFLDTRAMINIICAEYLRKVKTGVTLIEPTHYVLQ